MAPAKSKSQKLSLGEFLGDQSLGSWADEMEDMPVAYSRASYGRGDSRNFSSAPSFGDRSNFGDRDRGFGDRGGFQPRERLPLPTKPPYTAHLGNLSYDSTEGDIQDFFTGCDVSSVRIVEDRQAGRPKGFAYVEFGTLDGLKKALDLDNANFAGRTLRISVADPPKDRSEARELNDWTRKGPLPDLPNQRRASERPGFRNFDSGSDAGSERAERRRPPPFEGDGKVRDFGNWERKGPLSPVPPTGPALRDGGRLRVSADGPRERRASPAWGEARSNEGSRPPKERPQYDRQPTAPELDNQWRARMKPDAPASSSTPTPEASVPSSPAGPAPAATRPKLNLSKRTVSEAEPGPLSASSETKSSIFGGAKPIDTATREREIDEKRQLVYRQRKEQDDKAREEKRVAKEAAAKAEKEKGAGSSSVAQDGAKNGSKNEEKENGTSTPQPGRSYEILRRMAEDNEDGAEGTNDGPANGLVSEDKEVKPKEVVRDMSNESEESTPGPTAESLEEDGFSTVTRKTKNNRRGGARALAS